jgi:predicted amidophosphoribosyltransferase
VNCPKCGAPVRADAATCEECQRPLVGEAGNAPLGSDPPPPEPRPRAAWSAAVWGVVFTAVLTAAVLAVLAL